MRLFEMYTYCEASLCAFFYFEFFCLFASLRVTGGL